MASFLFAKNLMCVGCIHGGGNRLGGKPRILLIDDEAEFRFSASIALRKAGFEVIEAADGEEALSRIQECVRTEGTPDLLLTDLRMPFLCGRELLEALRGLGIEIPVIAITGYCDGVLREEMIAMGCTQFMEKPFEPDDLVNRVREVLANITLRGEGIWEER